MRFRFLIRIIIAVLLTILFRSQTDLRAYFQAIVKPLTNGFCNPTQPSSVLFLLWILFQIFGDFRYNRAEFVLLVHAIDEIHRLCALVGKLLAHCVFFNACRHFYKQSVVENSAEIHAVFVYKYSFIIALCVKFSFALLRNKIQIFFARSHNITLIVFVFFRQKRVRAFQYALGVVKRQ